MGRSVRPDSPARTGGTNLGRSSDALMMDTTKKKTQGHMFSHGPGSE